MDDRSRYERVKSHLRVIGEGTAAQVRHSIVEEPEAYLRREVQSTLDELVLNKPDEFEKIGNVYRWEKHGRFRTK